MCGPCKLQAQAGNESTAFLCIAVSSTAPGRSSYPPHARVLAGACLGRPARVGSDTPKNDGAYAPVMLQKMSLPPWMRSTRMASNRQPCTWIFLGHWGFVGFLGF